MTTTYRTGSWAGLIGAGGLALLSPECPAGRVRALWEAMNENRPLWAWVESFAVGGISTLPDFALARVEDGQVRILVRGQAWVEVDGARIEGEGMSTWREHVGSAAEGVVLAGPEAGGDEWPLRDGVVRAASVRTGADELGSGADHDEAVSGAGLAGESADSGGDVSETDLEHAAQGAGEADRHGESGDEAVDVPADLPEDESEDAAHEQADQSQSLDQSHGGDRSQEHDASDAAATPDADQGSHRGLIDSLPWNVPALRAAGSEAESHTPPAAPEAESGATSASEATVSGEEDPLDVTLMTGAGVHTPQSGAPWAGNGDLAGVASGPLDDDGADEGDHDGYTVLVSQVRESRPVEAPRNVTDEVGDPGFSAVLEFSSGQRVELDRTALIGRAPESHRFEGPLGPHLVTVPSPQHDISRTHVQISPEGGHVVVTDLNSTNGTIITLPGAAPRRLHPGEAVPVGDGAVVDLGDGVTIAVGIAALEAAPDDPSGSAAQPVPVAPSPQGFPEEHDADPYREPGTSGQPHPGGTAQLPGTAGPGPTHPYGPVPGPYGSAAAGGYAGPGHHSYRPVQSDVR